MNNYTIVVWSIAMGVRDTQDFPAVNRINAERIAKCVFEGLKFEPICCVQLYEWQQREDGFGICPKVVWEETL